jgi:hypothetical protein
MERTTIVRKQASIRRSSRKRAGNKSRQTLCTAFIDSMKKVNYTGSLPGIGFPDRLSCKLRYSQKSVFASSAAPSAQVFNINSVFDPDQTGTGHQPSYFDILSSCYSRYWVRGAWAKVTLTNQSSSVSFDAVAAYSDNNASTQTVEAISESRYAKDVTLGTTGAISTRVIDMPYISMTQIMGTRGNLKTGSEFYSLVNTNPLDTAYFYFKVAASDGTTAGVVAWRVDIVYDCVFKDVNPSYPS